MRLTREFLIPKNPSLVIERPELKAVVYVVREPRLTASGFSGKRAKPDFAHLFKSQEQLDVYIESYFKGLAAQNEHRVDRANNRRSLAIKFLEQLKPGVILYDTWGYEQTNVEFYKVMDRKGSKVLVQELGCSRVGEPTGWASDRVTAGKPLDKPAEWITVRGSRVKISDCISLGLWDGQDLHRSWYA